ncbi:MAG: cobaltochelatase subunit CobN [Clostridia bacterium]|nr:cobaltochelatase subunit CobN [Clostridia bacterium]
MNEDLNEKIKEIGSMFGIEEIPENIGDIVGMFLDNKENEHKENNTEKQNNMPMEFDLEKCVQIMNKYKEINSNKKNDKKIQLLYAIEPFLNGKRKDKVNNCVKFLTFASIAKDLKLL